LALKANGEPEPEPSRKVLGTQPRNCGQEQIQDHNLENVGLTIRSWLDTAAQEQIQDHNL